MGFWDFVAPDFESFRAVTLPLVPSYIAIGPVVLSGEQVVSLAWANPASGAGVALRLYYAAATYQVGRTEADALWSQVGEQLASPAFGDGGGFGGSFDPYYGGPMAQLIIPGAFRVTIEAQSGGQVVNNVVGVYNTSGTALGAAEAVRTAWKVAAGPLASLSGFYQLTGFRALELGSANGGIAFVGDTATGGGGTTSQLATNAACALVKWNGGTRSRSSRGRLYYGPLNEAQIQSDGRSLMATSVTAINTAFSNFRNSLTGSGYPLRVLSPTLQTSFEVTSSGVEGIIATQRRRIRS